MTAIDQVPLITNIHHFALDDGPGIRTTVFLKGCPLACIWCHNPESINPDPAIAFHDTLCIGCGECLRVCRQGALSMEPGGKINREACSTCGDCTAACPTTALRTVGEHRTVSELTEILLKDRLFYETSGGGVTFSGGEPALFMDYVSAAAKALKKQGIHIAIQTSGYFNLKEFSKKLLPYIDLIYFDIKIMDAQKHRHWTGKDNHRILENFINLTRAPGINIIPRIPLIPGITATRDNLEQAGIFLKNAGCRECELLSYNPGGMVKRAFLGAPLPETLKNINWDAGAEEDYRNLFLQVFCSNTAINSNIICTENN